MEVCDARNERAHELVLSLIGEVTPREECELARRAPGERLLSDARRRRHRGDDLDRAFEVRICEQGRGAHPEDARRPREALD